MDRQYIENLLSTIDILTSIDNIKDKELQTVLHKMYLEIEKLKERWL